MTSLAYEARLSEAQAQFLSSCPASGPAEEQVPTEEQPSDRQFTFLTAEEVLALRAAPWRVKDVLPAAGLAAIFGQPGSGKTFIALDMAFAVAEGRDWFKMQSHSGPVIYINLESNLGLKKRILAWQKDRGRTVPQSVRFVIEPFHILDDVEALARGIEPGAVVFLDTLNAASAGLDENSSRDMGLILEAAKKLQRLTNGLVVLVHHGGKDATKGLRGHSSLLAALDSAIEVSRNGESRFWRTSKAKEAEDGKRQGFRLKSVVIGYDEQDEPETSCVVEPDDSPLQGEKPLSPALAYGLESLETALKKIGANTIHLEEWRPVFYAGHPADKTDTKKKAFNRARVELLALKRISVTDDNYSIFQPGQSGHTGTVSGHVPAAQAHREPGQPGQHPLGCVPYVPMGDGGHGHA